MEGGQGELSPGQMLLMGFDGLFTRLDTEFSQLLSCVSAIDIPEAWGKVDAVCQARALQVALVFHTVYSVGWGKGWGGGGGCCARQAPCKQHILGCTLYTVCLRVGQGELCLRRVPDR